MDEIKGKSTEELENELKWYKETYENRKLIGIIKDRILINLKKIKGSSSAQNSSIEIGLTIDSNENPNVSDLEIQTKNLEYKKESELQDFKLTTSGLSGEDAFQELLMKAFDHDYYLNYNPDIVVAGNDPFLHYTKTGWREGRRPNSWFDPLYYLNTYDEVKDLNEEPLSHYLRIGKSQGKKPKKESQNCFDYLNEQNINTLYKKDYVEFQKLDPVLTDIKLIAFYLPQFHPIPENDNAWGKGFTEWTNVSKALPQFDGHYQPRLPGELGYYDLKLIEIQKRQIELAQNYGLHGFCYHYYWFDGKKVMDRPLQQIIDNPELDFPFCINWANENWTKRWDGLENDIILKQNHNQEDDIAFIEAIKPILKDKRYIKVNGKPLLMIYRPRLFPDIESTVKTWRGHAKKIGIGELYLVLTHSFDHTDPTTIGFDAATEFAPNNFQVENITNSIVPYNANYRGQLYDYKSLINYSISYQEPKYTKFRGICPSWDNEARKPGNATTIFGSSPQNYTNWLEHLCYYTEEKRMKDEKIIFINAWNEWAEGAYLEPDRKYGYAYLQGSYNILKKFELKKQLLLNETHKTNKRSEIAVMLHLHYVELWEEISSELKNFKEPIDLYISINNNASAADIAIIKESYPSARIYSFENRGRDILPFLKILKFVLPLNYKYICKIHTKKSLHRTDGNEWRNNLIKGLIGTPKRIKESLKFLDNNAGIVVSKGNLYSYKIWIGSNADLVEGFAKKANIKIPNDFMFPAGSMFWIKPNIFQKAVDFMNENEFAFEEGQIDGTIAHAYERIVGLLCVENNLKIEEV